MNAAAQELGKLAGLIAHQRAREPIWEKARRLCVEQGKPIPQAINPELILSHADKLRGRSL